MTGLPGQDVLKKVIYHQDPRSYRGMFSRGKAIYRGSNYASKAGPTPTLAAIQRRLRRQNRGY